MKSRLLIIATLTAAFALSANVHANKPVNITSGIKSVVVNHDGQRVEISRKQNNKNTVTPAFAKTSRPCPPFCIQPMNVAPGVETIGEIEIIDYVKKMSNGDNNILIIDSRTPEWANRGTIPGAINLPWTLLNPARGADPVSILEILEGKFAVTESEGLLNFSKAKTLIFFCNGAWCGQSPNNIKNLLKFGYPADKMKWYRGGMQSWESLGLTTI